MKGRYDMKQFRYCCDGGTLAIGTDKCIYRIPNNYGDGTFNVYVLPKDESLDDFMVDVTRFDDNWDWRGCVKGSEIKVYSYDCIHSEEEAKGYELVTLSGEYNVYAERQGGDILLKECR